MSLLRTRTTPDAVEPPSDDISRLRRIPQPADTSSGGRPTSQRGLLALLFLFLVAVYAATSGGHTSSNDEEEMYYVTEGLVERHSPILPPAEARALAIPRGLAVGPDGNYYSPYGPVQSVLAIPLYLGGKFVAGLVDTTYTEFLTRMAVTLLPAMATASCAVVLALLAQEVGASASAATTLALIYGLSTIAWPYARAFWSEPLATLFLLLGVWCGVRGSRRDSPVSWFVASLMLGMAVVTRSAMLASLPALGVYLLVGAFRVGGRPAGRRLLRQAGGYALGFLLPAVALAAYDFIRFGSILDTGNGLTNGLVALQATFGGSPLVGLYGLLLSPGKSIFVYAPPLLAGVLALPAFWRRARSETALVGLLTLSQLALVAPLVFWAGDAAWGPRYLVPLVPILLLPVVAWLERGAAIPLLVLLVGLGVLVQTLGNVANPHTYIFQTGGPDGLGAQQRWFAPLDSPVLGSARQLIRTVATYAQPMPPGTLSAGMGFYAPEIPGQPWPRWTNGSAELWMRPAKDSPAALELELVQPEPASLRPVPSLTVALDGREVPASEWRIQRPEQGHYVVRISLGELTAAEHRVRLSSATFHAREIDLAATDSRALGVLIYAAKLDSGDAGAWVVPVVPPLPLSATYHWDRSTFGWFYDPAVPHLVDIWPWYVSQSGLPPWLAWFGLLPLAAVIAIAWRLVARLRVLQRDSKATGLSVWLVTVCSILTCALVLLATVGGVTVASTRHVPPPLAPGGVPGCVGRCAMIAWAYRAVLGREPDIVGWLAYYSSSLDETQLRKDLCISDEGRRRGCDPNRM